MWSIFTFLFFLPMLVTSHRPCSEIFQRISAPENGVLRAQLEFVIYQAEFAAENFTIWTSEITFNNPINIIKNEKLNEYMEKEKNLEENIKEILKEKQNLLSKNNDVENKNAGLMNEIKKLSAQVESMNKELDEAKPILKFRNEEIVEAYRKKENLEDDKKRIMLIACRKGAIEVVRALLDLGYVGANDRVDGDSTGLISAAANNRANVVSLLLDRGADVNLRSTYNTGYTPLMYAAVYGSLESAQVLVSRGADKYLRTTDSYNRTALGIARGWKRQYMIDYLVSVGVPE